MRQILLTAALAGGFFSQGCTIHEYPAYATATPDAYVVPEAYAPPPAPVVAPVEVRTVYYHREPRYYPREPRRWRDGYVRPGLHARVVVR